MFKEKVPVVWVPVLGEQYRVVMLVIILSIHYLSSFLYQGTSHSLR